MNALIPIWILGGPFVGLLVLAFSFQRGGAAIGALRGSDVRYPGTAATRDAPLSDRPRHP